MNDLAVRRVGNGPEIVLVHGGAGPSTTWAGLAGLAARWTLVQVYRRGFEPSPPVRGRHDFLVDAQDLGVLFRAQRAHVVAHSYGVLGTLLAAVADPGSVRSLTLIEPPLYFLAGQDADVVRLKELGDMVLCDGLDSEPEALREFLTLAGAPGIGAGRLPESVAVAVRRAQFARLPGEITLDLEVLRTKEIPALVASGAHRPGIERICDGLAAALDAQRVVAPGAGHFVAAAPGFADTLERFLSGTDALG
ncbi:alpha/beta fold hydrolase [Nocardia acidivorans]|uniref:alpha/beta fold hydrolase n=1 Tax=Nocardia acidivorans TaxID=404580 RepID=UPI0008329764|nr:alpha/beta hydrolase [Nocardia acidivorans]